MRPDKRQLDELRPVTLTPGFIEYPEGSVLIKTGKTRVLCNVTVEARVPSWMQAQGKLGGWVTGEYAMLPRATQERNSRETFRPRSRTQEIRRLIGRSLRAAVNLEKLDGYTCIVDCDVLQADGGTRTASITGGYVALVIALRKYARRGLLPPDVLTQPVAAVSVGVVEGEPRLDLCYQEDFEADVDLNVILNGKGNFIEVQGTAEGQAFSRGTLENLLDLAHLGAKRLLEIQQAVLE